MIQETLSGDLTEEISRRVLKWMIVGMGGVVALGVGVWFGDRAYELPARDGCGVRAS